MIVFEKLSLLVVAVVTVAFASAGLQAQPPLTLPQVPYLEAAPVPLAPGVITPGVIPYSTQYAPSMEQLQPVQPYVESQFVTLYPHVKYKDDRKVAPGAVPYIIEVPLRDCCQSLGCTDCCTTACVSIKVCVPPCESPCVKVRRDGHKVRYDFGKYEVDVIVRRGGLVVVDYDA